MKGNEMNKKNISALVECKSLINLHLTSANFVYLPQIW